MIRRDDLQCDGLVLFQDTEQSCFSEDAVLLANYIKISPSSRAMDLGTGNGVIAILAAHKTGAQFVGIDIQQSQIELAIRSSKENRQEIEFRTMRVQDAPKVFGFGAFDCVVMNPPYFASGDRSPNDSKRISRHADPEQNLDSFLFSASKLLRYGGKVFVIYPLFWLTDLLCKMRERGVEPKRMKIVGDRVLVEGKKGGKSGIIVEGRN